MTSSRAYFAITGILKTERARKIRGESDLSASLSSGQKVMCLLEQYIKQTSNIWNGENQLFIHFRKPYGRVSKDTLARWVRLVIKEAGIDVTTYKAHSVRSAKSDIQSKLFDK